MRARRALLAGALALAACIDAGPRVGPGTMRVTVTSPHGDEGAAVLLLIGEGLLDAQGLGETEVFAETEGETTRVVLIHPTGGTLAFEVEMVDLSRPLVAIVREVAGPDDALRGDLAGYGVALSR
jgi:hypothetical protein